MCCHYITILKNLVAIVILLQISLLYNHSSIVSAFAIIPTASKAALSSSNTLVTDTSVQEYYCKNPFQSTTNTKTSLQQFSSRDISSSTGSISNNNENNIMSSIPKQVLWFQHTMSITAPSRGCHLITKDILKVIETDINKISIGMCNIFIQHTSASLTINENADKDVRRDMEMALNKIVPESWNYDKTFVHTMEGDDDMPGHVKSSLMGVSLNIPISYGKLALGTWQGIYLNEHRNQGGYGNGHTRTILITMNGQSK